MIARVRTHPLRGVWQDFPVLHGPAKADATWTVRLALVSVSTVTHPPGATGMPPVTLPLCEAVSSS
jgi:hypothetical protein